jgi:hypothetical protein
MLIHPTTDRLRELGLAGMPERSRNSGGTPTPPISASRTAWPRNALLLASTYAAIVTSRRVMIEVEVDNLSGHENGTTSQGGSVGHKPTEPTKSLSELTGEPYLAVLKRLHKQLRPKSYLEIGSHTGGSLALAECPSIAVDPGFNLNTTFLGEKTVCALYRMASDDFFASTDPTVVLNRKIDFAFLDGMHLAEFLLRDFLNVEKSCKNNSVVAIHDCIPFEASIARRHEGDKETAAKSKYHSWWTGDVWKVIVALKRHRKDLKIHCVNASPTGLVLVTNLAPSSTYLSDNYFNIVEEFKGLDLNEFGVDKFIGSLDMIDSRDLTDLENIGQLFWL